MSTWSQMSLQDASSPLMEQLSFFHDHAMSVLLLILSLTMVAMMSLMFNSLTSRNLLESQSIETIWTVLPAIILIVLALPSLRLLYLLDETPSPDISLKITGHQWFWSYSYQSMSNSLNFDSFMINEKDLTPPQHRLLDTTSRCVLPVNSNIRAMVTSADVIHSWALPGLGVKIDAVPGRMNQVMLFSKLPGTFFGQCSEICGTNHSFMPICMEFIPLNMFTKWMS